ncbi:hypothetical protein GIB67_030510 [Kingdonia uniflora]|uniref:Uncharacterized protein n=1 Tax=Kingdonia uniflora TaxID=39325 RepID=A0A7J7LCZ7_9MAGN|nr:hypothetical protein GIB67_030510 [Kingdonia uniflora]
MESLKRFFTSTSQRHHFSSKTPTSLLIIRTISTTEPSLSSSKNNKNLDGEESWNDAWESAWLPQDLSPQTRAPWETDVNFSSTTPEQPSADIDPETKAFVADMADNWDERRGRTLKRETQEQQSQLQKKTQERDGSSSSLMNVENMKKDYRLKKQRIHAGLWMKEIEKMEEAKLGGGGGADDIDRLLDSCSEIFDSVNNDMNNSKAPTSSKFKSKPDGWETTSKAQDGNVWETSQREEDILLQEFERRIAFSKFQPDFFFVSPRVPHSVMDTKVRLEHLSMKKIELRHLRSLFFLQASAQEHHRYDYWLPFFLTFDHDIGVKHWPVHPISSSAWQYRDRGIIETDVAQNDWDIGNSERK